MSLECTDARCRAESFTIQDPTLAPPEMPTTYENNSEWIKLCKIDTKLLASYGGKVTREKNYDRHAKKKQKVLNEGFDDIAIFLANKIATHNTTICTNPNPRPES